MNPLDQLVVDVRTVSEAVQGLIDKLDVEMHRVQRNGEVHDALDFLRERSEHFVDGTAKGIFFLAHLKQSKPAARETR